MKSFKHEDFKVGQIILHKWGIIGEVVDTTRKADAVDFRVIAYTKDNTAGTAPLDIPSGKIWKSSCGYIEDILGYTDNFVQLAKEEKEEVEETLTRFQAELNSDVKFYGNRKDYAAFIEGAKSLFESVNRR